MRESYLSGFSKSGPKPESNGRRSYDRKDDTMITLETLRNEKKAAILRLAERHGAHNVRVFGSIIHGENRPDSDVDFLVDLDPGRDLFDLGGLLADLKDLLKTKVDLVEASCLHPYIRDRVVSEAVRL